MIKITDGITHQSFIYIYIYIYFFFAILILNLAILCYLHRASLVAQTAKNLPAIQKAHVQSLGWEDSLEKEMAIHLTILAWRIPWTEESGGLQSMGSQRIQHEWVILTSFHFADFVNCPPKAQWILWNSLFFLINQESNVDWLFLKPK